MSYFDKKFSFWLVGFLVLLNIGSLSALWLSKKPPPPHRPGKDMVSHFIAKELGFDEQKTSELEALRRKFMDASRPLAEGKFDDKKQMFDAITKENIDTLTAMRFARSIGDKQQKLEVAVIQHYLDLLDLCTPEQKKKLGKVFHQAMRQGGAPNGPGHPKRQ